MLKINDSSPNPTLTNTEDLQSNLSVELLQTKTIFDILTPQERKVLVLAASDLTNKEIASQLYVTEETIKSHRKNILRKFDVKGRIAARRFFRWVNRLLTDELPIK